MARTITVIWVRQGEIRWEGWWVRLFGRKRKRIPQLADHISFANFDLSRNNCPTIGSNGDMLQIKDVPDEKVETVRSIIQYHGFEINSISNAT